MMRFCFCLLFLLAVPYAHASDAISVDMYADREQADIGEEINIVITYTWPENFTVAEEPNPADVFNKYDLFIVDAPPVERLHSSGMEQRQWKLRILAQHSGAWAIPRPGFQATAADGTVHTASAPEVIINIGISKNPPRLAEPSAAWTSQDSKEAGLHTNYWWVYLIITVVIAIMLIILLRKPKPVKSIQPIEAFEQQIARAQNSTEFKDAAAIISQALRAYCSSIWRFDGLAATNREMRYLLQDHLDPNALRSICQLLDSIEDIRWLPSTEHQVAKQRYIDDAKQWCHEQEQIRLAAEQAEEGA